MKLKYFIRGLGTGIVFCALIMLAAYMTSDNKISDKEIIERAENLGMVMEDDVSIIKDDKESKEEDSEGTTQSDMTEEHKEDATTEGTTEEITTEATTTEATTTETTTTEAATTEEDKKPATNAELVSAKITVSSGMTSTEVALLLEEAGIIDDYLDFDQYLNDNGYSTQIRINDYSFNSDMTYEELAKALIKEDKQQ